VYQSADLDRCRELWRGLTQRHRDLYGDPTLGGADPGLELDAYLDEPQLHRAFVAEVAGRVIGFCGLLLRGEESELEGLTFDY
jgi:hypothetical protein